ncbi:hypothetical protein J2787_000326 [Chryseobacterium rhizosphaerae]|uniref:Erythromycin esterase family protein n=3 Tax=Chryseobacterium rhizosphaerae TaxID=395937 RepID=A0AAE4BZW5_9FLAO|nr:hypothetical protein [Chryseobacterium rhizosphaerae]MDR6524956.1 hypothetical protein [Chryseobacterium rhizosphaerae]
MKKTFFLFFAIFSLSVKAQNTYKFSTDIVKEINNDKSGDDSNKYQIGAMRYSISNYYFKGLQTWDKLGQKEKKISKDYSLKFINHKVENAKDYIINKSKKEEIVILNEAHHYASHRMFAASLLKGLYENGYRYLGIEALGDDSINIRKFPTTQSGFYTSEPQFGNLIKTALDLGFTLFKYEAEQGKNGKEREMEQAENIYKFMQKNKNGKYFIYCGYEHAYEGKHQTWEKTMAGRLSDLTKINPLTIDQTQFSERSNPEQNDLLLSTINGNYPVVLLEENKTVLTGIQKEPFTDIKIIHPITTYIKARPNWMLNKSRRFYEIPTSDIKSYPSLIFAYRKGEFENKGVPADIIELLSVKDSRYLILDQGNYDIVIKDRAYKIINKFEKNIE